MLRSNNKNSIFADAIGDTASEPTIWPGLVEGRQFDYRLVELPPESIAELVSRAS